MNLTQAQVNFLWDRCVNHQHGLMASADSELDKRLWELKEAGALTHYDSMFGNRYYALTEQGRNAIRPVQPQPNPEAER
jgi:hypothetical protein